MREGMREEGGREGGGGVRIVAERWRGKRK